MRYRRCGSGVALIIALVACLQNLDSTQSAAESDQHRGELDSTEESSGVRRLQRQTGEITVLRAFFERQKTSCFVLNGIIKLGAGKIELAFAFAPGMSRVFSGVTGLLGADGYIGLTDDHCTISLHVSKQIFHDGGWRKLDNLLPLSHNEMPPIHPEDRVSDRLFISGMGFPHDPEPSCIMAAGLFAVTPSGLQLLFGGPPAALPFIAEQNVLPNERRVAFVFSTSTCRLIVEVEKVVRDGSSPIHLAPIELQSE